jgi:hypothetical protein
MSHVTIGVKALFGLLLVNSFLSAQSFSVGAKGGGLVSQPGIGFSQSARYVVGPSVEIGLPMNLAVEGNALYSRLGSLGFGNTVSLPVNANAWEFPILGKYYLAGKGSQLRPFVSGGYSVRKIWFGIDSSNPLLRVAQSVIGTRISETDQGPIVGGGVAFKMGRFHIAPEFRYTKWNNQTLPLTSSNQAQMLVGITF